MERRGRIPVAKFRTLEGKTRSRSRVREPGYNEQDPEISLFTLLEDNIALKEDNKELKIQMDEFKKVHEEMGKEKIRLEQELAQLRVDHDHIDSELKELILKYNRMQNERNSLDKLHKHNVEKLNSMAQELKALQREKKHSQGEDPGKSQKTSKMIPHPGQTQTLRVVEILPRVIGRSRSLIAAGHEGGNGNGDSINKTLNGELLEKVSDEFLDMKQALNTIELQLYEANEKIAELLENQQQLEEDNESLRLENNNLTKVAKLLTENMKESVETSQKMEQALIKLKQRNNELIASKEKDSTDGGQITDGGGGGGEGGNNNDSTSKTTSSNCNNDTTSNNRTVDTEESQLQSTTVTQDPSTTPGGERIVEMSALEVEGNMLTITTTTTNQDHHMHVLQERVSQLEEELRRALKRAEEAETELKQYKNVAELSRSSASEEITVSVPLPPPPPPPPLPTQLLYKPQVRLSSAQMANLPTFGDIIASSSLRKTNDSSSSERTSSTEASSQCRPKPIIQPTTGIDALVMELKSGRVSLRKSDRRTRGSETLQEMFQVLELSQRRNRCSQNFINSNNSP